MATVAPKKVGYAAGLKSKVASAGRGTAGSVLPRGTPTVQAASTKSSTGAKTSSPFVTLANSILRGQSSVNTSSAMSQKAPPFVDIANQILSQPSRSPGGAAINMSSSYSSPKIQPGVVQPLSGVPMGGKLMMVTGLPQSEAQTMGLTSILSSAKGLASSVGLGAAAGKVTGALGLDSTTSTGRAINPRTGRPYRRMDPLNVKALRRATRRLSSYTNVNRSVEKALRKLAPHKR